MSKGETAMTAFDLFQRATCEFSEGKRDIARNTVLKAISKIEKDGKDADCKEDLEVFARMLAA